MRIRIIGAIVAVLLAVAGTITVVFYVQGADERAARGAELVSVYVVKGAIAQGTSGASIRDHIAIEKIARNAAQPEPVTTLSEISDKVTSVDLLPGDQLVLGRFVDPATLAQRGEVPVPKGLQQVTLALPVERVVGGSVTAGSHVGIVVTVDGVAPDGTTSSPTTKFAFENVLVTKVQQGDSYTPSDGSSTTTKAAAPASVLMVTFAASTPDVERLIWAAEQQSQQKAGIWLTLQTDGTDRNGSNAVSGSNVFG